MAVIVQEKVPGKLSTDQLKTFSVLNGDCFCSLMQWETTGNVGTNQIMDRIDQIVLCNESWDVILQKSLLSITKDYRSLQRHKKNKL